MKTALSFEAIRQVILEQDQEKTLLQTLPLIERSKMAELKEILNKPWVKVIMGIRRSGKSTFAHLALRGRSYGYLNFDDERLIGLTAPDLNRIFQFLLELNPQVKDLFFDEIQNVEGWELFVNRLQRQGYNIIITGSNSKLLSKELATHLTGRYIPIELSPFSFQEFLAARQFDVSDKLLTTTKVQARLYTYLEEYLFHGGFPEMVLSEFYPPYLRELYDKILSRDITSRYQVKYGTTLKELAVYSFANLGNRLTFQKLKNIFEINSVHTIKNYFQYLSDAYLISLVNAFSFKVKEQIRRPRKVYTVDNGLSSAISPKFTQDKGAALENLVFQELIRRGCHVSYCAESDYEVDFVIHKNRVVESLIQVTLSLEDPEVQKREKKALLKGAEALRCNNLLILTWEDEGSETIQGKKIHSIPIWKWLLNL